MLRKLKFVFLLVLFYLEIRKIETKCPVHYLRIFAFFERLLLNLICLPLWHKLNPHNRVILKRNHWLCNMTSLFFIPRVIFLAGQLIHRRLPLGAIRMTYKALLVIADIIIHMKYLLMTREANFHSSRSAFSSSSSSNFFVSVQSFLWSLNLSRDSWLFSKVAVGPWEGSDISGIQLTAHSNAIVLEADFNFLSSCFLFSLIWFHSLCNRRGLEPQWHTKRLTQWGNGYGDWWNNVRTIHEKTSDIKMFSIVSP